MTIRVGVVMPGINLWDKYTKAAIDSVFIAFESAKANDIECSLLFIDNASTDNTREEATKLDARADFMFKPNDERWGFQKSVNYGVGLFKDRDYALVCNNDILLHQDAITQLVKRFTESQNPHLGMVTCLDVRGECIEPEDIYKLSVEDKLACPEATRPNFSAFMVNRMCWDTTGEMDELFFPAYFEDNDYHYRMELAGIVAIVYPPAMFYHYGSRTQNEGIEDGKPLVPPPAFVDARARYYTKWGGYPEHEQYKTPYNDPAKTIRDTQQGALPVEPDERMQ